MSYASAFDVLLPAERYVRDGRMGPWLRRDAGPTFGYTDGEAFERDLLEFLERTDDRSVLSSVLLREVGDWPRRYHLSPRRANLLHPLEPFLRGKRVLEIGAGCGGITRYLGESGCEVLAVEGSAARARVAAARCADLDAVSVVAETLQAVEPQPLFDVVTLIGVLEYARIFFPSAGGCRPNRRDAVLRRPVSCARRQAAGGHREPPRVEVLCRVWLRSCQSVHVWCGGPVQTGRRDDFWPQDAFGSLAPCGTWHD